MKSRESKECRVSGVATGVDAFENVSSERDGAGSSRLWRRQIDGIDGVGTLLASELGEARIGWNAPS